MRRLTPARDVTRIEGFSDAVFGFAATLLVVSLEVPRSVPALMDDLLGFIPFAVSFGALVSIWCVHHAFFRRYEMEDRTTILLNSLLLFVVLFYVYPLKFCVESFTKAFFGIGNIEVRTLDELASMFMVYSAGWVAIFTFVALLYRHAYRRRDDLEMTPAEVHHTRYLYGQYLLLVGVGVFSIFLAWRQVGVAYGLPGIAYVLLGPLCYGFGTWMERRKPAEALPFVAAPTGSLRTAVPAQSRR
jgi:uncharacterized membrane protein